MAIPVGDILISIVCSKKSRLNSSSSVTQLPHNRRQREKTMEKRRQMSISRTTCESRKEEASPDQCTPSHGSSELPFRMKHFSLCTFQTLGQAFRVANYQQSPASVMMFLGLSLAYYLGHCTSFLGLPGQVTINGMA